MARVKGADFKAVVYEGEGSEVKVIDEKLTIDADIKVDPATDAAATAAGSNPLSAMTPCPWSLRSKSRESRSPSS